MGIEILQVSKTAKHHTPPPNGGGWEGADRYDFEARNYDPQLGRWQMPDHTLIPKSHTLIPPLPTLTKWIVICLVKENLLYYFVPAIGLNR